MFRFQQCPDGIDVYVDSDFAGCARTRKSTAGCCAMYGSHCLKSWAKTLPVLALSSGEAELMAVVRGTADAMGLQALFADLGMDRKIAVRSDATAAIGIVSRIGLGKVRHLSVADLWVQQAAREGRVDYSRIPGQINPADMFTKHVPAEVMWRHMRTIGFEDREGRAAAAVDLVGN